MGDEVFYLPDVVTDAPAVRNGKSPFPRSFQSRIVGREVNLSAGNMIQGADKTAPAYFFRVLQFEGTAGRIARIGKQRLFTGFALPVEAVEGIEGHQHFSADFEFFRPAASGKGFRNSGNPAGIFRNVVSHHSVSAGEGAEKFSAAVCETDGRSVKLEFATICERSA